MAYTLHERDWHETPDKISAPLEAESESHEAPRRLTVPHGSTTH